MPETTPPVPLTRAELITINGQLFELTVRREEVQQLKSHEEEWKLQYEKEKALWNDRIEQEKKLVELGLLRIANAEKERDLALDKAVFFEASYNTCKNANKFGFWCGVKKVFTLGLGRCKK